MFRENRPICLETSCPWPILWKHTLEHYRLNFLPIKKIKIDSFVRAKLALNRDMLVKYEFVFIENGYSSM